MAIPTNLSYFLKAVLRLVASSLMGPFCFVILFHHPSQAGADGLIAVPMGLYEGMMGNSGVAISDPTAASYYNPSLLRKKRFDAYAISGNTLGSYSSKSDSNQYSSFSFNPSYLSTVIVGDHLVHELYILNLSPSNLKFVSTTASSDATVNSESNYDINQFLAGYSMAFRSVPLALSYFGEYSQLKTFGFSDSTSLTNTSRSTSATRTDYRSLGLGVSVSGHNTFGNSSDYTLGYHFRSRQLRIYSKSEGSIKTYTHGSPSASDYSVSEVQSSNSSIETLGSLLTIGHGFKIGAHEFLTDSQFQESSQLGYKYAMTQSFGYRMNSSQGHQILLGINHRLGSEIKYFGQAAYYSVGYSWLTRALRSGVGAYIYSSRVEQDVFMAGLTFGSEFAY